MARNHENNGECWEAAGLPGQPVASCYGECDRYLSVQDLIADPKGKVILLSGSSTRARHAAETLTEYFGRDILLVDFIHPEQPRQNIYGFYTPRVGGRILTIPERAVAAAMADYCARHQPGMRVDVPVALPRILQNEAAIAAGYINDFTDEARAYMLAAVCEEVFGFEAEVVDDGNGWTVVIRNDSKETIDAELWAKMQGACMLLQDFAIEAAPMAKRTEAPAVRHAARDTGTASTREMARMLAEIRESCARIEAAAGDAGGVPAGL